MRAYTVKAIVVTLGVAVLWLLLMPASVRQPLAFNHAKHTSGMACVVCHRGVETSTRAGFPPDAVCEQCHQTPPQASGASAVWPTSRTSPPIQWVRVNRMPDHVLFSHRRHVVLANLECASCHGDVAKRTTPVSAPATNLNMTACESCHARENANNDCAACHR